MKRIFTKKLKIQWKILLFILYSIENGKKNLSKKKIEKKSSKNNRIEKIKMEYTCKNYCVEYTIWHHYLLAV